MLFDTGKAAIEDLDDDLFKEKGVHVSVLRLDRIHPVVSGNKLFKLHFFLEEAIKTGKTGILTFGGAYSNHLAATAFACKLLNLKCIGIVRGERPASLSHTLLQCQTDGMELIFIPRDKYDRKAHELFSEGRDAGYGNFLVIPEGGFHPTGALGASLIMSLIGQRDFTHVVSAVGTATTLAGLLQASKPDQVIVGVPVLKGMTDLPDRIKQLTGLTQLPGNLLILDNYHFGGYAKKNDALIDFMNACWLKYQLPLDFVYTAKMLYAVIDGIKKELIEKESKILCLHTGGLQGNKSLPLNRLKF